MVGECERVQTSWFRAQAEVLGGRSWEDGALSWTDGPEGLNLMFPGELDAAAVRRGVQQALSRGRASVGAWLSTDVDPSALRECGFDRGWTIRWMAAPLSAVAAGGDDGDGRIELQADSLDYDGEHADYRDRLTMTRQEPQTAWYAAAYTGPASPDGPRRFAGRAWSYYDGGPQGTAGVFDMEVWPRFRRRGLGTGLLRTVCSAARDAGASQVVLNATDEGSLLYRTCGFTTIGEGITWWLHLR
ncbi:GNAT family N-acetyltransferase [Streptacidiphilus melanogenes]|uniref:GNAT family N-acetyltransferase n=1 Tax=Streptacidiphilus melanogenes TaxID=411235 RepID=UPI0005A8EEB1|nr:GNAT family N-acetyltransferase [Streptacidiphilus melanogenes]